MRKRTWCKHAWGPRERRREGRREERPYPSLGGVGEEL